MTMITVKRTDTHDTTWTVPIDLTGATVRLVAEYRATGATVPLASVITDAPNGIVTHTLTGTLALGVYDVELEVTMANGQEITFPAEGYETLCVARDLG